jgi:hypothetical protein
MAGLETRWKAVLKQLNQLEVDTRHARGEARARLLKLDRQTRRFIERTLRDAEPRVRQAMREATRIGRGLRAGVQAGAAAYRSSGRKRPK